MMRCGILAIKINANFHFFRYFHLLPEKKVKELLAAIKTILRTEIKNIARHHPGKVNGEVKEFLKIHTKAQTHSPTGGPIIIDKKRNDENVLHKRTETV